MLVTLRSHDLCVCKCIICAGVGAECGITWLWLNCTFSSYTHDRRTKKETETHQLLFYFIAMKWGTYRNYTRMRSFGERKKKTNWRRSEMENILIKIIFAVELRLLADVSYYIADEGRWNDVSHKAKRSCECLSVFVLTRMSGICATINFRTRLFIDELLLNERSSSPHIRIGSGSRQWNSKQKFAYDCDEYVECRPRPNTHLITRSFLDFRCEITRRFRQYRTEQYQNTGGYYVHHCLIKADKRCFMWTRILSGTAVRAVHPFAFKRICRRH